MSELINASDPVNGAAERTYAQTGFDPGMTDSQLSCTPTRVAKTVFNSYQSDALTVAGYIRDFAQYDGRCDGNFDVQSAGRGADLTRFPAGAFDELVVGPVGIIGDQGSKQDVINRAAIDFKIASSEADLPNQRGKVTFTDPWGDVQSYRNVGFNGWASGDAAELFDPAKAQGALGAAVRLHRDTPGLRIGLHIGGFEMSQAFHHIAKDPQARARFAQSLARIFQVFPMFTTLHLDWQWPSSQGAPSNTYGSEDGENYAALIRETKAGLAKVTPNLVVAVTAPASVARLKAINVPLLVTAGADRINLLTLDHFGSPAPSGLAHQANLRRAPGNANQLCADDAVTYLITDAKVEARRIHLGYTALTRNARGAQVSEFSPLKGTSEPSSGEAVTVGSFESGVSEYADVLRGYLDLEKQQGRNGFNLYTDTTADADFLYSPNSRVFLSLDTPRSVKAKAEYARQRGLGGLFAFAGDADPGVLTNAAHEGLGHTATKTVVDMKPFYFTGQN
ncbi:glycosyl hydrolase family 18 protein [Streptomyces tanashiensis]|uniref:glycosyl hydrolase family 18 protein n=1 Tax=Streptomyces tanashiensis TaxID=67367 RepID=UPI0033FB0442